MAPHSPGIADLWLKAEAAARSADADRFLREMLQVLPEQSPAAGFSGRVLASLPARRVLLFARPWVRVAIVLGLLWAGVIARLFPVATVAAGGAPRVSEALHAIGAFWVWFGGAIHESARALATLRVTVDALEAAAFSPTGMAVLATTLLIGASSFVALRRLIEPTTFPQRVRP